MIERPLATVGGLIVAPDGEILLVRSKKWSDLYSFPGGKVEWSETKEQAFRRETLEETGLRLGHVQEATVQESIFSPEFWKKSHFIMNDFIAYLHEESSKENVRLNDEAYEFIWISPQAALKLSLHKECRELIDWYLTHFIPKNKKIITIGVQNYRIDCIIGMRPHERIEEQALYVDVKVKYDASEAVRLDAFEHALDYVSIAELCARFAKEKKYGLIETFVCEVVEFLIETLGVEWAWIRVKKPSAIPSADYTFAEYEQCKNR